LGFLFPRSQQFFALGLHLSLLFFQLVALQALIVGIFGNIPQTTIHLVKVFGRKDKHQFIFNGAAFTQITHRLGILVLLLLEVGLQLLQLFLLPENISIQCRHFTLDGFDKLPPLLQLAVDKRQVAQLALHILVGGEQEGLGLLDLFLQLSALTLQLLNLPIGLSQRGLAATNSQQ